MNKPLHIMILRHNVPMLPLHIKILSLDIIEKKVYNDVSTAYNDVTTAYNVITIAYKIYTNSYNIKLT